MIKNRNWQVDWWNGKGVVMGFVRCYLRFSFLRGSLQIAVRTWILLLDFGLVSAYAQIHRCSRSHFVFFHCHFGTLVVVQSCRSVVSNLSSTLSVFFSFFLLMLLP